MLVTYRIYRNPLKKEYIDIIFNLGKSSESVLLPLILKLLLYMQIGYIFGLFLIKIGFLNFVQVSSVSLIYLISFFFLVRCLTTLSSHIRCIVYILCPFAHTGHLGTKGSLTSLVFHSIWSTFFLLILVLNTKINKKTKQIFLSFYNKTNFPLFL